MISIKKLLKIVSIIIVSILITMILAVVTAKIFEDDLASFTMEKLENQLNAPTSVGKVSLIPLFSFPRLSVEVNDLYIGEQNNIDGDTLLFINSLKLGLDSWDLISGVYTIEKMEVSGLDFEYIVENNGKSNIDFIINTFVDGSNERTVDTVSTPLDIDVEKLKLENIQLRYYDSNNNIGSMVSIPEVTVQARTKNNTYKGKTKGEVILNKISYKESPLDQMESCTIIFDLEYMNDVATINELLFISEGINLGLEGSFENKETLKLNTIIRANNLNFNILKKYLPSHYDSILGDTKLAQMESFSMDVDMDYGNKLVDVQKLTIGSEGLDAVLNGTLILRDTLLINANVEKLNLDFDILKKYIPSKYFKEYDIVDIGGMMELSAEIVGSYADSTLLPMVNSKVALDKIRIQTEEYPKIDAVNLTANISTGGISNLSEANIDISSCEILSGNNSLHLKGSFSGIENTKYSVLSNIDVNLQDFESLIPDSVADNLQGNIIASVRTDGILPSKITNDFLDYALNNTVLSIKLNEIEALILDSIHLERFNSTINYTPQGSGVKELSIDELLLKSSTLNLNLQNTSLYAIISGNISEPSQLSVNLRSLKANNGKNQIIANGTFENIENPEFSINTNLLLSLEELMSFVPDSIINSMKGTIVANIMTKGIINPDSLDTQLFPILFENSNLNIALKNINLEFPDSLMNVDSVSARLGLRNDILTIDNFSAKYNGLDLSMDSTIIRNLYNAVLLNQREELVVETHIGIGDIIFDDFAHLIAMAENSSDTTQSKDTSNYNTDVSEVIKNWTYLIHGSASINSIIVDSVALDGFNINQLHIDDLSTLFKLTDSTYIVDQFKFKVFEGEMNNSLHYKKRKDGTQSISTHNIISNMNVKTLLRDMDNFGLDSIITSENISGLFSTDLNTFVPIDDSILMNKMMVSGDITLEKGGVYNFAPAEEISRFTSVKELDNIQFKTLRSNIFMFKNKLYVPRTNIVSNAIDIAAFGMQDLDSDCKYHLELHLSNILFGKSKRRNQKQNSRGEEVDEESLKKRSQKIRYSITDRKSKVGPDNKDAREDMMNKIRVQKKMLDFIFFPKNIHYSTDVD